MASSASLKYGSLFGEDSPPSRSLGELAGGSGGSKAMAGTRPGLFHAGGPSATLSSNDRRYPGLFDDDVETMQPPPTATATPKAGLFADDGVANMAVTSIYNKTRAVPEAMNAQPIPSNPPEIPLSEDDESMFEMKYYEERARRIKLEARILELEKMVLSLRGQLALDACGSVGANVGSLDDLLSDVVLQSISTGRNEAGETCPEDTGTGSECRQAATVQERELARRQRHQRRPVSLTSRRLGLHSNKSFPVAPEHQFDSSSNIEDILPDLVMYETHETSHTEPTCGTTAREEISNVLSWSSDEDVKSGPSTVTGEVNSQEGVVNPQEKNIQDDAVSRRRQKAYRAALASRPTSRRLGNGRYSSARHVKPQIPAAENEPGHVGISGYEKWSESEESADGGGVSSAPMHNPENSKSRNDSIEWDSDGEQIGGDVSASSAPRQYISLEMDEESADRMVVAWARGKDIVMMIRTFCDIYEDAQSLPECIVCPQINCAADVRKAYLKIVKYCHPDKQLKQGGMKHVAPKLFSALTDAYNDFRSQGY